MKKQYEVPPPDGAVRRACRRSTTTPSRAAKQTAGKHARAEAVAALKKQALAELIPDPKAEGAITAERVRARPGTTWKTRVVRDLILAGTRPDGRDYEDAAADRLRGRPPAARARLGHLPARRDAGPDHRHAGHRPRRAARRRPDRRILARSSCSTTTSRRSRSAKCRPIRGPGRREIGHGALAERSVKPVLPDPDEFPYTIRVISDILESNGSSSMACVCGATLGLMAAGVPITNPVAGISVGLVKETDDKWTLLTDIIGDEDHFGDMDFKIAGTQNGITGIQLDLKINGISEEIIRATLAQSREARIEILRDDADRDSAAARRDLAVRAAAAADADRPGEDRPADRPGRQDDPRHPGRDRRDDRSRGRRHRDHRQQRRRRRPRRPCDASRP